MAIFAYVNSLRLFAWDVEKLLDSQKPRAFVDSTRPDAKRLHFKNSYTKQNGTYVRAHFSHDSGITGGGESLTHLILKEAFLSVSKITISCQKMFNGKSFIIDIKNVSVEEPVHISSSRILRVDVAAELHGPLTLIDYWGNRLAIEIKHTHWTEENKADDLYERRIPCFEFCVPDELVIDEGDEVTEEQVSRHQQMCHDYLVNSTMTMDIISRPIRQDFLRRRIEKLENEARALKEALESESSQLSTERKKVTDFTQKLSECQNTLGQIRAALVVKASEVTKLRSRTLWQRIWNVE